jgi:hypothetical protein
MCVLKVKYCPALKLKASLISAGICSVISAESSVNERIDAICTLWNLNDMLRVVLAKLNNSNRTLVHIKNKILNGRNFTHFFRI